MRSQMPPACRAKRRRASFEASVPFAQTYLVEPLDGRHGVCLAVRLDVRRRGLRLPEQLLEHGALSIKQGQNSLLSPHLSPPFRENQKKKKRTRECFTAVAAVLFLSSSPPTKALYRTPSLPCGVLVARLRAKKDTSRASMASNCALLCFFSSRFPRSGDGGDKEQSADLGIDFFLRNPRNSQSIHQFWVEKEHEKTDCKAQGEALEPGGEEDSAEDSAEDR